MKTFQAQPDSLFGPKTATLVFGVAGRIGSGASFITKALMEELKAFGYRPMEIKITDLFLKQDYCCLANLESHACYAIKDILKALSNQDESKDKKMSDKAQRIKNLQTKGNTLREKYGNDILAALSIYYIIEDLRKKNAFEKEGNRYAYVIDSLKHPDEIDLLKEVFGKAFYMIGAVANDSVRKQRLYDQKRITSDEFKSISERDAAEEDKHGQQTTKAILKSDYFFENNYDKPEKINQECKRLLSLLFQSSIVTPKQDEYGMHLAFVSADKSACLSRQVGAVILSESGNVLATGCNDVPKFGGGLYNSDSIQDNRCFAKSGMCHNDLEKQEIAQEIIDTLKKKEITNLSNEQYEKIKEIMLRETRLKQLIEFSRAVHAEMDAIVTVARSATPGLIGSIMYVTTYPCHNCAKHIIDSGIKRVVFLEPYEKSLALRLHSDAINNPLEDCRNDKVRFDNYGGVSPKRYTDFFSMHEERKDDNCKLRRKSFNKDELLPLDAQEVEILKKSCQHFTNWFNQKYSSAFN